MAISPNNIRTRRLRAAAGGGSAMNCRGSDLARPSRHRPWCADADSSAPRRLDCGFPAAAGQGSTALPASGGNRDALGMSDCALQRPVFIATVRVFRLLGAIVPRLGDRSVRAVAGSRADSRGRQEPGAAAGRWMHGKSRSVTSAASPIRQASSGRVRMATSNRTVAATIGGRSVTASRVVCRIGDVVHFADRQSCRQCRLFR